tara:strand:- start:11634 stop:13466 length:1833 start_codon:yes stop_codon:yes gene_type:complete
MSLEIFYNAFGELIDNNVDENFSNIYDTDSIEQFSNESSLKQPKILEATGTKEASVDKNYGKDDDEEEEEEQEPKKMPKMKDQDFLAMDGNLILKGVVKASDFIKEDGTKIKEVPILKNNYILPNDIKYTAGGILETSKFKTGDLKSKSIDSDTIKTRKAEIAGPLHLYDKKTKGDDSDPYRIEKIRTGPNKNQLRVILHDDKNESMAIWGNSCSNGKCQDDNKAKEAHKFDVTGNVIHKGQLNANGVTTNGFTLKGTDLRMWNDKRGGKKGSLGRALVHIGRGNKQNSQLIINYAQDFGRGTLVHGRTTLNGPTSINGPVYTSGAVNIKGHHPNLIKYPSGLTKISRHGIMFGGANRGKEVNSAQISAGIHEKNSLNIVGMSSNRSHSTRAVTMWAEKGFKINGFIKNNMPDTRNINATPQQYRNKMQKGVITEFKTTSRIELKTNLYGAFGVLTTTVPWRGLIHQKFESVYKGQKCICERVEQLTNYRGSRRNEYRWGPWNGALEIKRDGKAPGVKDYNGLNQKYEGFGYTKVNGLVTVTGLIKHNSKTHLATLPRGYRPRSEMVFNVNNNAKTTRVDVSPNGQIRYIAGGRDHNWLSLSGISFVAHN